MAHPLVRATWTYRHLGLGPGSRSDTAFGRNSIVPSICQSALFALRRRSFYDATSTRDCGLSIQRKITRFLHLRGNILKPLMVHERRILLHQQRKLFLLVLCVRECKRSRADGLRGLRVPEQEL